MNGNNVHGKNIFSAGKNIRDAGNVLIMLHGRGGSAEDILSLAQYFSLEDYALLAPQAINNTWYPYSFLSPPLQNEPWLSSALSLLKEIVNDIKLQKISEENTYFLGFSQGACLMLEFVTRNAAKFGGVVAFTGGLIGDKIYRENYKGNFNHTPIFIGSSNPDIHVPVERVYATTNVLRELGADVTEKLYDNMGHTINEDEIEMVKRIIFK
jgi:phospholipase/carboxylesterase